MKDYELPVETRRAMNDKARLEAITRLEADILIDMAVCEIEGWDKLEYISNVHPERSENEVVRHDLYVSCFHERKRRCCLNLWSVLSSGHTSANYIGSVLVKADGKGCTQ